MIDLQAFADSALQGVAVAVVAVAALLCVLVWVVFAHD